MNAIILKSVLAVLVACGVVAVDAVPNQAQPLYNFGPTSTLYSEPRQESLPISPPQQPVITPMPSLQPSAPYQSPQLSLPPPPPPQQQEYHHQHQLTASKTIISIPTGFGGPENGNYKCRLYEANNKFVRFDLTYVGGGCVGLNSDKINMRTGDKNIPGTLQFADNDPPNELCREKTRSIKITYNDMPPPNDRIYIKIRLSGKHDVNIDLSECQKAPHVGPAVKSFPFENFGSIHRDIAYRQLERTADSVSFTLTYVPKKPGACLRLNSKQINLRKDIRNHASHGWIAASILINPFIAFMFNGKDEDVSGTLQSLDKGPTFLLCPHKPRSFKIGMTKTFVEHCEPGRLASAAQIFIKVRVADESDRDVKNVLPCYVNGTLIQS